MSLLLSPRNPKEARRVSLAKAGPYASSLLTRERLVVLEWEGGAGGRERSTARLGGSTRPGDPLSLQLMGRSDVAPPPPGALAVVVVPVPNMLWRFTTTVHGELSPGRLTLAWPLEVLQETGRRFARAECMVPVTLAIGSWHGRSPNLWESETARVPERSLCTYTMDLSLGGAQLAIPRLLTIGTPVRLELRLPRESVRADASIAWTRPIREEPGDPMYATGVQFSALAPLAAKGLRVMLGMSGVGGAGG